MYGVNTSASSSFTSAWIAFMSARVRPEEIADYQARGANGVIATFDCLQEPEGPAMLQAWTSEGVTSPVSVAVASSEDGRQCAKENTRRKPRAQQARAGLGAP